MGKKTSVSTTSDLSKATAWEVLQLCGLLPGVPGALFRLTWGEAGPREGKETVEVLDRATELFLTQISFADFCFFKQHGYILIEGKDHTYHLYPKRNRSIHVFKQEERIAVLDSRLIDQKIPLIDQIISQYILLKAEPVRYIDLYCEQTE